MKLKSRDQRTINLRNDYIRSAHARGDSYRRLARAIGLSFSQVRNIVKSDSTGRSLKPSNKDNANGIDLNASID